METASLSVIEYASKYKESLLLDRYKASVAQVARGTSDAPFAYVVPQDQRDPVAAVELLRRLAFGGVRVSQLTDAATMDGRAFPAGTWVIPTDQEFAAMAREVLDIQHYPDLRQYPGGPPERPYDAAGWTLPLQMGVDVVRLQAPIASEVRAKMKLLGAPVNPAATPTPYRSTSAADRAPFDSVPGIGFDTSAAASAIVPPAGTLTGTGAALAVKPAENNAYRAINQAWKQGATVRFANGRYVIEGLAPAAQAALVSSLALSAERVEPSGPVVRQPRIGVFDPWSGSMDAGWTRWVLEQYGFPYVRLRPEDFAAPLADKVDVVLLADDARIPVEGAAGGRGGRRGGPGRAVRPEYADTVSADDLRAFEQFIRAGGTVVCLNNATAFAIRQFNLPVRNVVAGLRPEEFFLRGSIVEAAVDQASPVMAGMPARAAIFADSSPVFETLDGFSGTVLARYRDTGSPLLSGYVIGEQHMQGKAAALDVRLDAGHVILLGFRPEWRGQPFGTFKVLFNAVTLRQ